MKRTFSMFNASSTQTRKNETRLNDVIPTLESNQKKIEELKKLGILKGDPNFFELLKLRLGVKTPAELAKINHEYVREYCLLSLCVADVLRRPTRCYHRVELYLNELPKYPKDKDWRTAAGRSFQADINRVLALAKQLGAEVRVRNSYSFPVTRS